MMTGRWHRAHPGMHSTHTQEVAWQRQPLGVRPPMALVSLLRSQTGEAGTGSGLSQPIHLPAGREDYGNRGLPGAPVPPPHGLG